MSSWDRTLISRSKFGWMTLGTGRFTSFTATSSPVALSLKSHVSPVPPLPRNLTSSCEPDSPKSGCSTSSFFLDCDLALPLVSACPHSNFRI